MHPLSWVSYVNHILSHNFQILVAMIFSWNTHALDIQEVEKYHLNDKTGKFLWYWLCYLGYYWMPNEACLSWSPLGVRFTIYSYSFPLSDFNIGCWHATALAKYECHFCRNLVAVLTFGQNRVAVLTCGHMGDWPCFLLWKESGILDLIESWSQVTQFGCGSFQMLHVMPSIYQSIRGAYVLFCTWPLGCYNYK